jgi:hypothetical protein
MHPDILSALREAIDEHAAPPVPAGVAAAPQAALSPEAKAKIKGFFSNLLKVVLPLLVSSFASQTAPGQSGPAGQPGQPGA